MDHAKVSVPAFTLGGRFAGSKDGGTRRREAIERLGERNVREPGGVPLRLRRQRDVYVIADLPDEAAGHRSLSPLGASSAGSVRTTVLLTPETVDEAVSRTVY